MQLSRRRVREKKEGESFSPVKPFDKVSFDGLRLYADSACCAGSASWGVFFLFFLSLKSQSGFARNRAREEQRSYDPTTTKQTYELLGIPSSKSRTKRRRHLKSALGKGQGEAISRLGQQAIGNWNCRANESRFRTCDLRIGVTPDELRPALPRKDATVQLRSALAATRRTHADAVFAN